MKEWKNFEKSDLPNMLNASINLSSLQLEFFMNLSFMKKTDTKQ